MGESSPKRKQSILIIEDTPDNILILMETLKTEHAVAAAKNGRKGLQMALEEPRPDIILLDIMMPGMNGYEVCRELKADIRTRSIPVIFITALSDVDDEARGLALGAVDYITKPFQPELVRARVRNHLQLKMHRDHLDELVRERTRELALTQEVTIESLATLTECRDPATGGHIKRTQSYVKALAEEVMTHPRFCDKIDTRTIELLYLSAPLHDVGKVGVRDAILLKPDKLTPEEYDEMKHHTRYGRDTLAKAEAKLKGKSFLSLAREIAYSHHEKWDGSGYPEGLKGDDIPYSARLMALADVYDALISKRVYKPPFSHQKAREIIAGGKGTHFDPDIVDAFLKKEEAFRLIALKFADFNEEKAMLSQTG